MLKRINKIFEKIPIGWINFFCYNIICCHNHYTIDWFRCNKDNALR